jgi:hypothetical protein
VPLTYPRGYKSSLPCHTCFGLILNDIPVCVVRGDGMGCSFGWDRKKTEAPCHSRRDTIKIPLFCPKVLRVEHRLYLPHTPSHPHEIGIWESLGLFLYFSYLFIYFLAFRVVERKKIFGMELYWQGRTPPPPHPLKISGSTPDWGLTSPNISICIEYWHLFDPKYQSESFIVFSISFHF